MRRIRTKCYNGSLPALTFERVHRRAVARDAKHAGELRTVLENEISADALEPKRGGDVGISQCASKEARGSRHRRALLAQLPPNARRAEKPFQPVAGAVDDGGEIRSVDDRAAIAGHNRRRRHRRRRCPARRDRRLLINHDVLLLLL